MPKARPVQAHERVHFVDVLRGFAVLGVLIANMYSYSGQTYNPLELTGVDRIIVAATRFLVEAKFYSLFSFLFGWGMAVQMLRAEARGTKFVPVFLRRLFLLLVIGTAHSVFIWTGDILMTYASYGFLLLALCRIPRKVVPVLIVLVLLLPIVLTAPGEALDSFRGWYESATAFLRSRAYPESLYATGAYKEITRLRIQETLAGHSYFIYTFGNIFAMFLLGLYVGKRRIFQDVHTHLSTIRRVMWGALPIGLICNAAYIFVMLNPDRVPPEFYRLTTRGLRTVGAPALMLFYVSTIVLLVQKETWRERLAPLGSVGRMALTNYLLHSVINTLLFYHYGLGLYGEVGPLFGLGLSITIYLAQVRFSGWWLGRYRYGPVEWVWRVLTYGGLRSPESVTPAQTQAPERAPRPLTIWLHSHTGLVTIWVLLLLWAGALGAWWTRAQQPGAVQSLARPAAQARATATARAALATPTAPPPATPVTQPLFRDPGPAVRSGDLWTVGMSFHEQRAFEHIVELAAPAYEGRRAGTEGGRAAADYIERLFEAYDLQPAGDDGGYFQEFSLDYFVSLENVPALSVTGPDGVTSGDYRFREDFTTLIGHYGGEGEGEGDVIWANYCDHDDFDDLDVVGKVVLCRGGGDEDTLRNGIEHGVAGLLMWQDPEQRPLDLLGRYRESWVPAGYPSLAVSPQVVEDLLQGSGLTLADLTIQFDGLELATRARLSSSVDEQEAMVGRNVLGVIPGGDPEHADDVVIVGGHYDHMGSDPDGERCPLPGEAGSCETVPGAVWAGANDNASGIASLLEIARVWKESGYVPDRTVLFGAWDAEEQGLWGAIHYVQHPAYPLTKTVAMLQLDMVGGGGDLLGIDGAGPLATKLDALAATLGITTAIKDEGMSDHVPFRQSGVPASLLIWDYEDDPYYHRPGDVPQTVALENLGAAGRLTNVALLNLASEEPDIRDLLEEREAALATGDRARFLATSDAVQQSADGLWWDDVRAHDLREVELSATDIVAARQVATATLGISFKRGEATTARTVNGSARFRRTDEGWRYAGPALAELSSGQFTVAYAAGQERMAAAVLESAEASFSPLTPSADPLVSLFLYGNVNDLRVAVSPALPLDIRSWVDTSGASLVASTDLTSTQLFSATLTQLALAQTGMQEAQAPWLWAGLPLIQEATVDPVAFQSTHLPRLQRLLDEETASPLLDFPTGRDVTSSSARDLWQAQAWGMTAHLVERYGADAPGRLAAALGRGPSLEDALEQVTGLSPSGFQVAWQEDWRSRLIEAEEALQTLLTGRQSAVITGDADGFLATVDPADSTLLEEERHWFADLSMHLLHPFELEGQLLALTDEGALSMVRLRYQLADRSERRVNTQCLLRRRGDRWFWAGVPLETVSSEHFRVRYPAELARLAQELPALLEEIYARETNDLAIRPAGPVEVKLYPQAAAFRSLIALSLPDEVESWAKVGTAIKILVDEDENAADVRGRLAYGLALHLLGQQGLEEGWLLEGIAQVEESRIAPQSGYLAARRISRVQKAAESGQLPPLAEMPPFDQLDSKEADLAYGAVRDAVSYLVTAHGQDGLNELVRLLSGGEELDAAFQAALGATLAESEEAWHEWAARGHVPVRWADDALTFDGEAALAHVRELAGPAYDGRESGTAGGEAAARYVAGQFAALGLQPVGEDGSYLQSFPLTRTISLDVPRLTLRLDSGPTLGEYVYGHDFQEVIAGGAGGGTVTGKVVWVRDDGYANMDLGGKIVLRRVRETMAREVQKAIEHGAAGLLAITDVQEQELQRRTPLALQDVSTETIPVLELTRDRFERLVEESGYTMTEFNGSPPALPLRLQAEMVMPLEPPQEALAFNVLGLLPGNDPELAQEMVILSAHHDHVGRSPDGTLYPGADDDASGVGVLLEVARVWHEQGVRPSRSVLFAAWGAEEFGQLGSRHYVDYPVGPLEDTVGVFHLDSVGAGRGFFLTMEGDITQEALLRMHLENSAEQIGGRVDFAKRADTGDHSVFQMQGVPAALVTWDESEDDANHPGDTIDRVDALKLTKTGRILALALRTLAE